MHEGGGSANFRCQKLNSHGLADRARLQDARGRWLGELVVQESKLEGDSRPGNVAKGTSEVAQRTCGAGKKVSSKGLADPARLQEARARWLGELAVQESKLEGVSRPGKTGQGCTRHEGGGSANLRCMKVSSQGLAYPTRLQEARARWLGELAVQESKLEGVSRPGKVARGTSETGQGCTRHEGGGSANLRCMKVSSQGLAYPTRLQEARARWLGEFTVQDIKLARVSRPGKVARGTSELTRQGYKRHEGGGSANLRCKKVISHGLADPARLHEARARWLGELAVQECKLEGVRRPHKVARDLGRLQEARARWLGELAMQEIKLARISRTGKVARATREVPQLTCGAGKKVSLHGLADQARLQDARGRWLAQLSVLEIKLARETPQGCKRHERVGSANLRCKKLNSHGLADPAMLQEALAKWLGELAVQEIKLARVNRPSKVERGKCEVARRTCGAGKHERVGSANLRCKKLNSHGLADRVRLQEAPARWLGELKVLESYKRHERGGSVNLRCKKVISHGLADPARLKEARARLLGELAVSESLLERKVNSHGLADRARLQEARARWLGELAVQESKLARVSRPGKVARGTSEVARRT
ncbi:hypothetical protein CRG98_032334 [Punica granatum]|uniref:Uncharacterized protein n=1 Tax=Punica granatum TaxID=22663 RepID=A0A2I0ITE4_PUNGR|nr:hypothetical protein CRG98_032334 [Punica granatum]